MVDGIMVDVIRRPCGVTAPRAGKRFKQRLEKLHEILREQLDPKVLELVVPQGWTLDLTENACCELRRWDKARKHRKRGGTAAERQQKRLVQLRATWRQLGFTSMPLCGTSSAPAAAMGSGR